MASDDEEELEAIRAARKAALGDAGVARLAELRRRAEAGGQRDAFYADPAPRAVGRGPAPPPASAAAAEDDEDAPTVVEVTEEEEMRAFSLPTAFGVKAKEKAPEATHDALRRAAPSARGGDGEGEEEEEEEAEAQDEYNLPITHEAVLAGHSRLVTALAVEQSGSRLVSGSLDFGVRLYDFAGMKRDLKPFRELEPCGAHQIRSLAWSPSGENFMAVSGSAEPKILDRDGRELGWFVRGDMYIRDAKHTRGHIMGCTGGAWHPHDRAAVLTCSEDGTLRTWDISQVNSEGGAAGGKCQTAVIKPAAAKPGRWAVTACAYSADGRVIAGGVADGTLQLWSATSNFASAAVGQVLPPRAQGGSQQHWAVSTRPLGCAKGAHGGGEGESVTALAFRRDGVQLAARSADGFVRIWDTRQLRAPLMSVGGLPTGSVGAGLTYSPDEGLLLVPLCGADEGRAAAAAADGAGLAFFETRGMQLVRRLGFPAAQAAPVAWHGRLNQIFVGAGGRAAGGVRCLYSPDFSDKGVLLGATRAARMREPMDLLPAPEPEYIEQDRTGGRKRIREEIAERMRSRRIPQRPTGTYGAGGRVGGGTGGTLLTQHLLKSSGTLYTPDTEEDIRAAILRNPAHSELVDVAYAKTQPVRIFAEPEPEEDEEEEVWGAPAK